jgi:ubiquinol-cytochrome c reductase subunit 6
MSEAVDPRAKLDEDCKPHCTKYAKEYEACVERVRAKGHGHCTGQSFDLKHCLDHCAAPKLWKTLAK